MVPLPARKKGVSRVMGVGAIIVVALVISASILLFAQLAQRRGGSTQGPPLGEWVLVLNGYAITSLAAARSNPAILYACATQTQAQLQGFPSPDAGRGYNPTYTVLHSSDFGTHWQNIGAKTSFVGHCQLAINPTDSNDIYVVSGPENVSNGTASSDILKHSTDGGRTWKAFQPTLDVPGLQTGIAWQVQQISMVGNRLLGLQPIPARISQSQQKEVLQLVRLVTSIDGGYRWSVLDNQFQAVELGVRSYAVNSSNSNTMYELLGRPLLPIGPVPRSEPPPTSVVPHNTDADLYRTTDGGAQWQLVLKSLPFGSQVQLASNKPQVIYAGGSASPLPLTGVQPAYPSSRTTLQPDRGGSFNLHVSSDGGITWREIAPPLSIAYVQSWLVGPTGRVYVYGGGFVEGTPGEQLTATGRRVPPGTPKRGGTAPTTPSPRSHYTLESYNPTTNKWSKLSEPQIEGTLLTVTPTEGSGDSLLWFMASTGALYRYRA